jgi:hypothetical protein
MNHGCPDKNSRWFSDQSNAISSYTLPLVALDRQHVRISCKPCDCLEACCSPANRLDLRKFRIARGCVVTISKTALPPVERARQRERDRRGAARPGLAAALFVRVNAARSADAARDFAAALDYRSTASWSQAL